MFGEDIDETIDAYLDNRLDQAKRAKFEEQMKKDPDLRARVMSATQSVQLVQRALGWVTPNDKFDDEVNSKIINITQSGHSFKPALASSDRSLTSNDPDARLLADPDAAREKRRLMLIALVAGLIFFIAAAAVIYSVSNSLQKPRSEQRKTH